MLKWDGGGGHLRIGLEHYKVDVCNEAGEHKDHEDYGRGRGLSLVPFAAAVESEVLETQK